MFLRETHFPFLDNFWEKDEIRSVETGSEALGDGGLLLFEFEEYLLMGFKENEGGSEDRE